MDIKLLKEKFLLTTANDKILILPQDDGFKAYPLTAEEIMHTILVTPDEYAGLLIGLYQIKADKSGIEEFVNEEI